MLKKTITYTDFDGNERTETFHFNITEAEVTEMEVIHKGGMTNYLEQIVQTKDPQKLIELFQFFIQKSYGVKSLDGRTFTKNPEVLAEFISTQAYSDLYMELGTDPEKAAEFINAILPKGNK